MFGFRTLVFATISWELYASAIVAFGTILRDD